VARASREPATANPPNGLGWTNTASGYWEQPYWSLGVLPATNVAIQLTNYSWKALAIGPNTAQNYPQTLNIGSLSISSPTNSFNELLLNDAGLQTPTGANVVLSWGGSLVLETATNVLGPYQVLTNAHSPYAEPPANPSMYFRLRPQ